MKKRTQLQLKTLNNKTFVLLHTDDGILKISHKNNVMIIQNAKDNLFKHELKIRLVENVNVFTDSMDVQIEKGAQGFLKMGRLYFKVKDSFIGLGKEYLMDKTEVWIPNLC